MTAISRAVLDEFDDLRKRVESGDQLAIARVADYIEINPILFREIVVKANQRRKRTMMNPEQTKLLEGVDDEHLPEAVVKARAGAALDSQEQKEVDDFCKSFAAAKVAQGA